MARPRTDTVQLNLRMDRRLKERLAALAFHEGIRAGHLSSPDEINVSDFVRGLLEEIVGEYEASSKKTSEELQLELAHARVRQAEREREREREVLEQMERALSASRDH